MTDFAAALTLALGIAATTALVSVVYAVLVNPLPFPESARLVQVWRSELPALTYGSASYARYLDWRANQQPFAELGAWAPRGMTLAGVEGPERVSGATASSSFFRVMGERPVAGRWIEDADDRRGAAGDEAQMTEQRRHLVGRHDARRHSLLGPSLANQLRQRLVVQARDPADDGRSHLAAVGVAAMTAAAGVLEGDAAGSRRLSLRCTCEGNQSDAGEDGDPQKHARNNSSPSSRIRRARP